MINGKEHIRTISDVVYEEWKAKQIVVTNGEYFLALIGLATFVGIFLAILYFLLTNAT